MTADRTLIQSYPLKRYLVSTIWRPSSSMLGGMFYETLVWTWDDEKRERGHMIAMDYKSTRYRAAALVEHAAICAWLCEQHPEFQENDE